MTLKTELISPERRLDEEVRQQNRKITSLPYLNDFLDAMPNMALVLNDRREVVFANRSFAAFLGYTDRNRLVGLRQGEAFGCIYSEVIGSRSAEETECARVRLTGGGCGTSEFCQNCGALISVLNSRENGRTDVQECRMVCGEQGVSETSLDLRVWSRPVEIEGEAFTIFSVIDIGDEKRRKALEKVFFHDVLNTASGVKGLADLLAQTGMSDLDMRDVASMISESTEQLIEEIHTQRMLADAESGDLTVSVQPIHSLELACWILRQFSSFSWGKNRRVLIDESAEHFEFFSDPTLVRRVLINLVKNAVEAVPEGGCVTLNCYPEDGMVCFEVRDDAEIPAEYQSQLFVRSFSTKGEGRGLGTYSVKLITEKYLGGCVSFSSSEQTGTVFKVSYPVSLSS